VVFPFKFPWKTVKSAKTILIKIENTIHITYVHLWLKFAILTP